MGSIFCPGCRCTVAAEVTLCPSCGLGRPPTGWPVDAHIGRVVLGKYRIDRRLAAGGFGTVFIATQVHGGIEMGHVILKFLHQEHATDPTITKRFLNEVKTARELINPHIVRVFDLGYEEDGTPFMVQEFIEGEGLDEVLSREKRLPPASALKIIMQVAEGMAEAHRKGIVHRDLKPENLRIQAGTGLIKILDFGIARIASTKGTATNSFIGTPRYMPPEQIKQMSLDNGVDIFALGVILFETLAGEPPIPHQQSELEYIHLNLIQDPRRLNELLPDAPAELSDLVNSMMAKDRALRPPSMEEVVSQLQAIAFRYGWTEDTSVRFLLAPGAAGGRGSTLALPTRDRTPSPAASQKEPEEVLELVPVQPRKNRAGLWIGLAGGLAVIASVAVTILIMGGNEGGNAPAGAAASPVEAGVPSGLGADAGTASAKDVEPAEATGRSAPDAGVAVKVEDVADAAAEDAAASVKIEPDAPADAPAPPLDTEPEAAPPVDAGPAPVDAGAPRDAGAVRRDSGTVRRDSGTARDSGSPFQRLDSGTRDTGGSNPFTKVGGLGGGRTTPP